MVDAGWRSGESSPPPVPTCFPRPCHLASHYPFHFPHLPATPSCPHLPFTSLRRRMHGMVSSPGCLIWAGLGCMPHASWTLALLGMPCLGGLGDSGAGTGGGSGGWRSWVSSPLLSHLSILSSLVLCLFLSLPNFAATLVGCVVAACRVAMTAATPHTTYQPSPSLPPCPSPLTYCLACNGWLPRCDKPAPVTEAIYC